jgi:hypothetical protein
VQAAQDRHLDSDPKVEDLAWLEGTWTGRDDGGSEWESVYTGARGGRVVGASKELKDGRCVMIDFEHFYERAGALRMTPYPFGKPSVEFTLANLQPEARMAVFENPEHDFPRNFVYHRAADDRLVITLTGDMGQGEVEVKLDLRRAGG